MSAPTIDAAAVREDGPSVIRFESRAEFHAARDSHIVTIINPFDIFVRGAEVRVPVLFGDGNTLWRTVAVYPTQKPCDCDAEVVHQLGCSAREYPDVSMFAEPAPVDPIDWATVPECADCGVLNGAHQSWCWRASRVDLDAAALIPVVVVDLPGAYDSASVQDAVRATIAAYPVHYRTPDEWTACGYDPRGTDTRHADRVTCPDCLATLDLPRRTPGAALVDNPALPVMHYHRGDFSRPCGVVNGASSDDPSRVTCPDCLAQTAAGPEVTL